ncbi:RDD family protein [Flavobacterium sp. 3HN19-14]|uniref:RDD family protein n=1 Tax=Flavobacterium sp. 3HN19-14 TaxID=3448133 RepID=UPI003EDF424F
MTQLSINTTQNVNINFTAASLGERLVAAIIDVVLFVAYTILLLWLVYNELGLGDAMTHWDRWSAMAVSIILFSPVTFYTLVMESIFEGQTVGKMIMKIKVVKIDGYQASFGDYLIRWLFRLIEIWTTYILGLIVIVVSSKAQRLGDMAAGTAMITLKNKVNIDSTILEEIDVSYVPIYPGVIKLSDNDVRIIKETMLTAIKAGDYAMLSKLRHKVETVAGIKNQSGNDHDFIRTVIKDYNFYTQKM